MVIKKLGVSTAAPPSVGGQAATKTETYKNQTLQNSVNTVPMKIADNKTHIAGNAALHDADPAKLPFLANPALQYKAAQLFGASGVTQAPSNVVQQMGKEPREVEEKFRAEKIEISYRKLQNAYQHS